MTYFFSVRQERNNYITTKVLLNEFVKFLGNIAGGELQL